MAIVKIAVYPGSFNPWHDGHEDIVWKALKAFDKVIIAVGKNPEKGFSKRRFKKRIQNIKWIISGKCFDNYGSVEVIEFDGLLVDLVKTIGADVVVRGLRTGSDLEYERIQQYWNEDLGLAVPIVYFLCDRKLSHISSSAIRALDKIKEGSK